MPNSGFQVPQAPDWGRFAEQAINLIANKPIPNTAAIVDQAVQQINGILKMGSPEERLKRQLEITQLGALKNLYTDYQANPQKYQMTAHGPVLIDPFERAKRIADTQHTLAATNYLNKKTQGSGTPAFISQNLPRMQAAMQAEKQGVTLPPSKSTTPQAVSSVDNQAAQADPNAPDDTATTQDAISPPVEGSGAGSAPIPFDKP